MGRRYQYHNPRDASPHYGILNCLIGFAVLLCLWNIWTAPSPTTPYSMGNNEKYVPINNDERMVIDSKEELQEQKQWQNQLGGISSIPYSSASSDGSRMVDNPYLMMVSSGITTTSHVEHRHQKNPKQVQLIPLTMMNVQKMNNLSPPVTHSRKRGEDSRTTAIDLQLKQQLNQQLMPDHIPPTSARKLPERDNGSKRNVSSRIRGLSENSSLNDSNPSLQTQSRSQSTHCPEILVLLPQSLWYRHPTVLVIVVLQS